MKLYYHQLEAHLKAPLKNLYWSYGEPEIIRRQAIAAILNHSIKQGWSPAEAHIIDKYTAQQDISSMLHTASLFRQKRVIHLIVLHASAHKWLVTELNSLESPQDIIIVQSITAPTATQLKTLKHAVTIPIYPFFANKIPLWISQNLKNRGMHAHGSVIRSMMILAQNDENTLMQMIEKLYAAYGATNLAMEMLNILNDSGSFDVNNLQENILQGDAAIIHEALQSIKKKNIAVPLVLWHISQLVRNLLLAKGAVAQGATQAQALQAQSIPPFKQSSYQQLLNGWTALEWQNCLNFCHAMDKASKQFNNSMIWCLIEELSIIIAQQDIKQLNALIKKAL